MEFNFIWSSPSSGAPIISIASYGITFNGSIIELLKNPVKIKIGFDPNKKVLGIKPLYIDNVMEGFPFASRERNGYVRIGNKDLVKFISAKIGIDFQRAVKFIADWNEEHQILLVDLSKPLDGFDEEEFDLDEE